MDELIVFTEYPDLKRSDTKKRLIHLLENYSLNEISRITKRTMAELKEILQ